MRTDQVEIYVVDDEDRFLFLFLLAARSPMVNLGVLVTSSGDK